MNDFTLNANAINSTVNIWNLNLDDLSFNDYWLQNENIITVWEWFWLRDTSDTRNVFIDKPQGDGQILNSTFLWGRTMQIKWALVADNPSELNDLIDEFKLQLSFPNKLLKWKVNGIERQILATIDWNISFEEHNRLYIFFTVNFKSQSSYWRLKNNESVLLENISSNNITEDISYKYKQCLPTFIFWVKTWSITELTIKNNGIGITINETINAWDIIYINWELWKIYKNWVEIDFNNVFPLIVFGSNNLNILTTWTYTADLSIILLSNLS